MFLERKFSSPTGQPRRSVPAVCPVLPSACWADLPELVYDVVSNLQLLLHARRRYAHRIPDFGLSSTAGSSGLEAQLERLQAEVPDTFARYERRFSLTKLDVDLDSKGRTQLAVVGSVVGLRGSLAFKFGAIDRTITWLEYRP